MALLHLETKNAFFKMAAHTAQRFSGLRLGTRTRVPHRWLCTSSVVQLDLIPRIRLPIARVDNPRNQHANS